MFASLPKSLTLINVAVRMTSLSSATATMPYRNYNEKKPLGPLGGLLLLDLIELPEPARAIDDWTIRPGN